MAEPAPFTILEHTFTVLAAELHPLTLDGRLLGPELPARPIPIGVARTGPAWTLAMCRSRAAAAGR
jgi:hypothetical protein